MQRGDIDNNIRGPKQGAALSRGFMRAVGLWEYSRQGSPETRANMSSDIKSKTDDSRKNHFF